MTASTGDLETLVRYAIPGALLAVPLFYLFYNTYAGIFPLLEGDVADLLVVLALLTVPLGYILHQFWLALFNCSGIGGVGYCRGGRENLCLVVNEFYEREKNPNKTPSEDSNSQKQETTVEKMQTMINQWARNKKKQPKMLSDALMLLSYYAWESWVYNGAPKDHLGRARRLWQFYHSSASTSLACLTGIVFLMWIDLTYFSPISIGLTVGYLFFIMFMLLRSRQLFYEVVSWETMMLHSETKNVHDIVKQSELLSKSPFLERLLRQAGITQVPKKFVSTSVV